MCLTTSFAVSRESDEFRVAASSESDDFLLRQMSLVNYFAASSESNYFLLRQVSLRPFLLCQVSLTTFGLLPEVNLMTFSCQVRMTTIFAASGESDDFFLLRQWCLLSSSTVAAVPEYLDRTTITINKMKMMRRSLCSARCYLIRSAAR
ncbi:hypothetical protein TNCV_110551 [Trichonephila clavipes]|nr:hypothetical protein TNCV_110551 [Trichonephila clavipes]